MNTIAFQTLGCKMNFSESSDLARKFVEQGFCLVDFNEVADIYVINTCSVTALAEKKCRNAIRQAVHQNPNAIIAAIGCFSEINPQEIQKIEGIHYVLGNADKHKLIQYILSEKLEPSGQEMFISTGKIQEFVPSYSTEERTRSFVKIQDGCDYFCSYCTIPHARGRSRSLNVEDTLSIIKEVVKKGYKEIILTGINLGDFGKKQRESFYDLLCEIEKIEDEVRFRISSIEPDLLTSDIIQLVAQSKKFLPHFHIPLQSGCDATLKRMNRRYAREVFTEKLMEIKSLMPLACIAADVIVGFPGETEEEFRDTYQFIESLPISYLHIFTFSERPHTQALLLENKVPMALRRERSRQLHQLSDEKKVQFYEENKGGTYQVLWESNPHQEYIYGFTENYIKVKRTYASDLENQISRVRLTTLDEDHVFLCESFNKY